MTEDYTRLLGTLLQLPLNLYFKIKIKKSEFSELAVPLSSPGRILGFFFFFFSQHGHQTPVFTSTPSEETKESEADSCLQARPGMWFFNFAEGRKRIARSN